jgi:hypothetical protein
MASVVEELGHYIAMEKNSIQNGERELGHCQNKERCSYYRCTKGVQPNGRLKQSFARGRGNPTTLNYKNG